MFSLSLSWCIGNGSTQKFTENCAKYVQKIVICTASYFRDMIFFVFILFQFSALNTRQAHISFVDCTKQTIGRHCHLARIIMLEDLSIQPLRPSLGTCPRDINDYK